MYVIYIPSLYDTSMHLNSYINTLNIKIYKSLSNVLPSGKVSCKAASKPCSSTGEEV